MRSVAEALSDRRRSQVRSHQHDMHDVQHRDRLT